MKKRQIILKKVNVHNLKGVDVTLDTNELVVLTGVSGSGKSSLAFDTLYMEGQRRYVESLSTFARRQLGDMAKPDLEHAEGISPTISIEQKTAGRNPRSTVGTMTEVYDYLRVLFARVAIPHCPVSGERVTPQSRERIIRTVQGMPDKTKLIIFAPFAKGRKGEFKEDFNDLLRKGFMRARVDGELLDLNDEIALDGTVAHDIDVVIDRTVIRPDNLSRVAESLTQALNFGEGVCSVLDVEKDDEQLFSMHAFSPKSGLSYTSLEPQDFSFNSPAGMCSQCGGLGTLYTFDLEKVIDPSLSIAEDCCSVASSYTTVRYGNIYKNLARLYKFKITTLWKKLPEEAKEVFLHGTQKKWTRMLFVHPTSGKRWVDHVRWQGVLHEAQTRYAEAKSDSYKKRAEKLMSLQTCPTCDGGRLKAYPAAALLNGKAITELAHMTIDDCLAFFEKITLTAQEKIIAEELLKEVCERLTFLKKVGLHYLTLDRTAPTLSGGEAQRVRLASQIGCGLVGITYILDEPSIGLHPRDNRRLIGTLKHLRDMGNTVIVVEHDEETMWEADRILDFGPGPGILGGEIIVNGDISDLIKSENSLTAGYLTGKLTIPIPKRRRKPSKQTLQIKGATHHNLKNIDVKIPLEAFIAVTGVSGSGKSSLIADILHPELSNRLHKGEHKVGAHKTLEGVDHIDKVIAIDQSPIGRNPRSNPSTYIKLFDEIRDLFSQLPESRARGFLPGRFSFNVKEGSCAQCSGMGMVKIDMDFMDDAWVDCPLCQGRRFDHETLSVFFKGKTIYDVLEMEVDKALEFFKNIPSLKRKLEMLHKVGLGYIKLGQSSTTLSGGEAQRIKLAKELVRPATGKTLYILDEPTTGLHFHDIKHLLEVLHALVERGNTVLVIEHNMDVVKTADWIIDLGPEGGAGGGELVAVGKPEKIAKMETPTGQAVREAIESDPKAKVAKALEICAENRRTKKERKASAIREITVQGAEHNNLKHLDLAIPREKLTICTGPSGSGKSSLAFDTIYAEGQRRYIESLSPYARQFVKQMPKPKVGQVEGLSPAVAIEQKTHAGNPRSTVGTMTEAYDYLRILFARVGLPHCPETGEVIKAISKDHVVERVLAYPEGEKIQVLAPIELKKQDSFDEILNRLRRQGFLRIRLNKVFYDLDQDEIPFDKKRKNALLLVIDRLKVTPSIRNRLFEAVENASDIGAGKLIIVREEKDVLFNLSFAVESTGKSYPEITPHTFAFNHAEGMCRDCTGLGFQYGANLAEKEDLMEMSVQKILEHFCGYGQSEFLDILDSFFEKEKIDPHQVLMTLPAKKLHILMNGSPPDKWYPGRGYSYRWPGINNVLAKAGRNAKAVLRSTITPLLEEHDCPTCQGSRVNALARHVTINGKNIGQVCRLSIGQVIPFIEKIALKKQEAHLLSEVKNQLLNRLRFLDEVGLHYMALERKAPTLSGGETQRIRLARQLGSGLTGVLYVLDEPTIGLHPRDNDRLNKALKQLRDLGNTMLMVEHDPMTIETADYVLDFGPQSGDHGGHITAQGTVKQIKKNSASLTGAYLSGKQSIPTPQQRRKANGKLTIKKASTHNLKNLSLNIPTGVLTCVTGVSGSGKSTLINHVILPAVKRGLLRENKIEHRGATISGIDAFDKVIAIDQKPIGTTVRANVCTYVDVLTPIRELYSQLPDARSKGLLPRHFSYNHRRGMCTNCWGLGFKRIEMHFLPPVQVLCEDCQGLRLNPVSLLVKYKGKNVGQLFDTTIDEARLLFENHPRIIRILDTLIAVGLGYLKLGQGMATLSGGEAQRIKLSRELAKRSYGKTLYTLDEPTTGLHSDDIQKLLKVLHTLVDKGNTMVIIEHNLDIIKNADHVIDIGPDAGKQGGKIVCTGTPEQVAKHPTSWTGKYLRNLL